MSVSSKWMLHAWLLYIKFRKIKGENGFAEKRGKSNGGLDAGSRVVMKEWKVFHKTINVRPRFGHRGRSGQSR